MRLATFVSRDYRPTTPHPRRGRCCFGRCNARATIEITHTAGPERGPLRPGDASQVVVRRPFCSRHVIFHTSDGHAFGPAPRDLAEVFARGDEEVPL